MKRIINCCIAITLIALALFVGGSTEVQAATYSVTNLNDSGAGSLRQAIIDANANPGPDIIEFSVAGTINILSQLQYISDTTGGTIIDGTTAPGYAGAPVVVLHGPGTSGPRGLKITSANNEVRALQIDSFSWGIDISDASASGNVITGCYLGNDGSMAIPNGIGIVISSANNRIGTDGDGVQDIIERNVISGNNYQGISITGSSAWGNVVAGNFIGTDATGATALSNLGQAGITVSSSDNLIGTNGDGIGDVAERNIISGNAGAGIYVSSGGNVVAGNYIGTDVSGMVELGNVRSSTASFKYGVYCYGANNRIGTDGNGIADEAERNVISGNSLNYATGVYISGGTNTIIAGNYIGTDATGTVALPNRGGLNITSSSVNTRIGTDGDGNFDVAERNIISGNNGYGIQSSGSTGLIIAGNYIGTDVTGEFALGNTRTGIRVTSIPSGGSVRIGTNGDGVADEIEYNIVSNSGEHGISILNATNATTIIAGNYIGTDITGAQNFGNAYSGLSIGSGGNIRIGTNGDTVSDDDERNIISGNAWQGISSSSSSTTLTVAGNYIGTDGSGTTELGNGHEGIWIQQGTDHRITDNIISSNGSVGLRISGVAGMVISDNIIGSDIAGTLALGNQGHGVSIESYVSACVIGGNAVSDGNLIAFNTNDGLAIAHNAYQNNTIRFNSIHSNGGLGIDLKNDGVTANDLGDSDTGPNDLQNFPIVNGPVFDGANTALSGTINSTANTTFTIDVYGNTSGDPSGHGEGQTYLGTTTCLTDGAGDGIWALDVVGDVTGLVLSSTATDPLGNTSEFSAPQPMLVVTNLNDSGEGSLRSAIENANAHPGPDNITFEVAGTINVLSQLPTLSDMTGGTIIDGATAPGYVLGGPPVVALQGPGTSSFSGLRITSAENEVRALQIGSFRYGLDMYDESASNNAVTGCYLGTDGTNAVPNEYGIRIFRSSNNRIGTDGDGYQDVAERNVISGNAGRGIYIYGYMYGSGNVVAGNYIGTDATGTSTLTNGTYGVYVSSGSDLRIGTNGDGVADDDERNVISGNTNYGIYIEGGSGYVVAGNYIGTDAAGTAALPNGTYGVSASSASDLRIGTNGDGVADDAERNVISGNGSYGIRGSYGSDHVVAGNYIGTDFTGTVAISNNYGGVSFSYTSSLRIGTDLNGVADEAEANLISGNINHGVNMIRVLNAIVAGNYVGTDMSGASPLGNTGAGVYFYGSDYIIGGTVPTAANVIAFNGREGVYVSGAEGNTVRLNSIYSNGRLGIDLKGDGVTDNDPGDADTGPNALQNFPGISDATFDGINTAISGMINSTANTSFTIDIYSNTTGDPSGYGEGETYLGTTISLTDSTGNGTWTLDVAGDMTGLILSATATDPAGNTSEFSAPLLTNTAPVAVDDACNVDEDNTLNVPAPGVLGNDTDAENDPLTAILVSNVSHGTLTLYADGSFTYTPEANFNGTDSFTYKANDGELNSNIATVTITVNPVNDAPVADNDSATTDEDTAVTIDVLTNDSDVDGDVLTVDSVIQGTNGSVTNNGGDVTYTPDADFCGSDSFTYTVSDGNGGTDTATVDVIVTCVNDDPVAGDDSATTPEDTPMTIDVLANDDDVDGDSLAVASVTQGAHGSVINNGSDVTYSPDADFCGSDSFTYTVSDGNGGTDIATVDMNVTCVNDDPVAGDDSATTDEDTAVTIDVLANDTDVEGDTLTVASVIQSTHGSVTNNGSDVTYSPDADFCGSDSFTYTASDGNGGTDTATVNVTVICVNDSPVAVDDTATTDEDTAVIINVLANDSDVDGDTLTVDSVTQGTNGSVTNNGSDVTYTPDADFCGSDSFTYTVSDGNGGTDTATVDVTITCVNDAPVAKDDAYSVDEDDTLTVAAPGVLGNDSDVESDPFTAVLVSGPANGSLTLNDNGSFTYEPEPDFNGTDSFTYQANDGTADSNIATVTISVTPVDDLPVANDDSNSVAEDSSIVGATSVLANDTGLGDGGITVSLINDVDDGTLTLNTDGTYDYTPDPDFNGTDSFVYEVCDTHNDCDQATVTITVNPVNDAPVAVDDSASTYEDTAVTINVLVNDSDVDGDSLTVASVTQPSHGLVVINPDGTITYTPTPNYHGSDSFTYRANDSTVDSNVATVTITVTSVNDPPVTTDDDYSTDEDTLLTLVAAGVLANDSDIDSALLRAILVTDPAHGTLILNTDGSFTYEPDLNFNGTDSFTYKANDGAADSDPATVTITVSPINDAPVANDDSDSTNEDMAVTIDVLTNDADVDGDILMIASVTQGTNGSVTSNGTDVTYTPDADFCGSDSFTYTASDGNGGTDTATVEVSIACVNDPPNAVDDNATVDEGSTVTVLDSGQSSVLANDSDPEGNILTVTTAPVSGPSHGTLTLNADGTFSYTHDGSETTGDSFTYQVCDDGTPSEECAAATVNITVNPVNDPPVAEDQSVTSDEDTPAAITLTASDAEGSPLSYSVVTPPTHGTLTGTAPNLTYTPDPNYYGPDSFTFKANDGAADSNEATVTITVNPVNDPPVVTATQPGVTADEGQAATNSGTVSDVEGDPVTLSASVGTVSNNGDGTWSWSFTTSDGPTESQTVTITADDGTDTSQTTFDLTVNNIAPSVDAVTVPLDPVAISNQPVSASATFSDPAGSNDETYSCTVNYGDGSGDQPGSASGGICTGPDHTYASPGVYVASVTVTDKDGASGSASATDFIVIYDPEGGFVTGGGWIWSEAGFCKLTTECEGAEGKANFGFVSKYKKGADIPTGETEFQFKTGNLNFHSDSYEWLVVAGPKAMYKGVGTINGAGNYGFMLSAIDEKLTPSTDVDLFRIKIWDKDNGDAIVYDNQMGAEDDADPTTAIGGGNIVIHK